ncbi:ABC transporter ATP-binding protein [Pelosinus sp. sgz500959]|uniref:ABC transporter ATP-binding protein n=1 Tax=Pelosinus sp. sgz500959 TaxID=3242472 RepID=UPI00366F5284
MIKPLLDVQKLSVSFATYAGPIKAIEQISFQVFPGEIIGIVGESGCGKSVTAHSIMQLIPTPPGKYQTGKILFEGVDLLQKSESEMAKIRGNEIGMIFQDPMTSLNPVLTIGMQIAESLQLHQQISKKEAYTQAAEMLRLVGIPSPKERIKEYPHQFSGGMRQRAMIAMALSCHPKLLIADEPTTALDVTIQAQILNLMKDLQSKLNTAIILISHDLGVIATLCSRVIVMYAGKIAEVGTAEEIFHEPQHPYTWGLLQSVPRMDVEQQELIGIEGQPPDLLHPAIGCPFHPRCSYAMTICTKQYPETTEVSPGHSVKCWLQHADAPKPTREVKE